MTSVEILVPISLFAMIALIVYIQARKKIHLTLIQHGKDAKLLKTEKDANISLKIGLLMVGISLGILLGNSLVAKKYRAEEPAYFSMILICGGVSLILYYFLINREAKKTKTDENKTDEEIF